MGDRDDNVLRHYTSRSAQPKLGVPGAANKQSSLQPVNVVIMFESPFGDLSDRDENLRFRYMGTSPMTSSYEGMNNKRVIHDVMNSLYDAI